MALYLLSKIQAGHTFPTIDASFYAIKFFHKPLLNVCLYVKVFIENSKKTFTEKLAFFWRGEGGRGAVKKM